MVQKALLDQLIHIGRRLRYDGVFFDAGREP